MFEDKRFDRAAFRPEPDLRGAIPASIDEATAVEKSPFSTGFVAALKAALVAAPMVAGVQALRGKDPVSGAIGGGLIAALAAGLATAAKQKTENLRDEAIIRYHTGNIKAREPYYFMPPRPYLGQLFTKRL